jgi:hypothetical protein
MTSEKNRLPSVAAATSTQQMNRIVQSESEGFSASIMTGETTLEPASQTFPAWEGTPWRTASASWVIHSMSARTLVAGSRRFAAPGDAPCSSMGLGKVRDPQVTDFLSPFSRLRT